MPQDCAHGISCKLAELIYLVKFSTEKLGSKFKKELKKYLQDKLTEEEIPIPEIDDLIDEKENKFNYGWE